MYPFLIGTCSAKGETAIPVLDAHNENLEFEEIFLLSGRDGSESVIRKGVFAGLGLNEVLNRINRNKSPESEFPVYIKLINSKARMPVKVYPDDEYAMSTEGKKAKKSLIYIAYCTEDAEIVYGLRRSVSYEELKSRTQNGSLSAICNYVTVQKGDVFFVPSGVVFSIGAGITAVEISLNSDTEYIISDCGRNEYSEELYPIKINRAIEVMRPKKINIRYGNVGEMTLYPFGTVRELGYTDSFKSELVTMDGNAGFYEDDSFVSIILLSGEADMSYPSGTMHLKPGNSVLLPPGVKTRVSGRAEIIYTKIIY